jgi:hypothetical protein
MNKQSRWFYAQSKCTRTTTTIYISGFPGEENFTWKPNDQMDFRSRGNGNGLIGINAGSNTNFNRDRFARRVDSKLDAAAYNNAFKGVYLTEAVLIAANPSGSVGDYARE